MVKVESALLYSRKSALIHSLKSALEHFPKLSMHFYVFSHKLILSCLLFNVLACLYSICKSEVLTYMYNKHQ